MTAELGDWGAEDTLENLQPVDSRVISLAVSNFNLPQHIAALGGVEEHWAVLRDLREGGSYESFDGGYEITPTRCLARSMFANPDAVRSAGWPFATSVHQSWSSGLVEGVRKSWPSPRGMGFNVAAAVTMPEERQSMTVISRMSRLLGGVPAVAFGESVVDGEWADFNGYDFPIVSSQLKPEFWRDAGGDSSYRAVHDSLVSRGVLGSVVATNHMQRSADDDPDYVMNTDVVFAGMEREGTLLTRVHAEAGRLDTRHDHDRERSMQELAALLKDPDALRRTKMGELLLRSMQIWKAQQAEPDLPEARQRERQLNDLNVRANYNGSRVLGALDRAVRLSPVEMQYCREAEARKAFLGSTSVMPVVLEVPFGGLKAHRGGRVSYRDFVSMTQDMGVVLTELFEAA